MLYRFTFILILLLSGCSFYTKPDTSSWPSVVRTPESLERGKFWTPTEEEKSRAEQLARWYATNRMRLKLPQEQVEKMRTDYMGTSRYGKLVMIIQFYDPKVYQPNKDGFFESMFGGFPSYFSVTVDVETWRVVDDYASPE
jgi:hypothetical protein